MYIRQRLSANYDRSSSQLPKRGVSVEPVTMLSIKIHGRDRSCELDTEASVSILDVELDEKNRNISTE